MIIVGCANGDVVLMNSPVPQVLELPVFETTEDKKGEKGKAQKLKIFNEKLKEWIERRIFDNFGNVNPKNGSPLCKTVMEKLGKPSFLGRFVERHVEVHQSDVVVIQVCLMLYYFSCLFIYFLFFFFFFEVIVGW
jgi:hypothetical protein